MASTPTREENWLLSRLVELDPANLGYRGSMRTLAQRALRSVSGTRKLLLRLVQKGLLVEVERTSSGKRVLVRAAADGRTSLGLAPAGSGAVIESSQPAETVEAGRRTRSGAHPTRGSSIRRQAGALDPKLGEVEANEAARRCSRPMDVASLASPRGRAFSLAGRSS